MRKKKGFLKLYNILSPIYLYITVQNCHFDQIHFDTFGPLVSFV